MRVLVGLLAMVALIGAIYPDDHWTRSHQLTTSNFDDIVKQEVDAGKTLFAPAWNRATEAFENNKNVAFGDVNLSEEQIRGNHNPGAGGWPTVRYFNKETGYEGRAYEKKTTKSMCDELGDDEYMQGFVMEAASTSLCSIETKEGCSDKEGKFIDAMNDKGPEDVAKQIVRLEAMKEGKMKPELKKWIGQRLAILKQFADRDDSKAEL